MSHDAARQPPTPGKAAGTTPEDGEERPATDASADTSATASPPDGPGDGTEGGGGGRATGRLWSARRVPAAVLALILAVVAAVLLYEAVAASIDKSAAPWRREVTGELDARPLDDLWVIAGAALTALLGLWLLVLALTPGLRGLLPMRGSGTGGVRVRAWLERSAAELTLRDRLLEVPGVQSARVRVGRHRITTRVRAHFRPLEEVRGDVDRTLEDGVRLLGLARRPRLSTRVRRPKKE
ncbi:DUF6286 domain-containing protein [Streptomyces sp. TRM 70361]|uniref:DUF6286 domain-containing protein n=1 Tax=Streptomyces sp. TRM 70361 TaxID=3116553 RepID=UPI002E7AC041|nr:DUF6286 domain-containing protein [Streptomyces sp. TRM 70361]MEE1941531.1 DUF6286 domain-containing protein [Streptomyces sp. TRM 70361]